MTTSDAKLRRLAAQIEVFRSLDPEMPSQIIAAFLLIAMNPGVRVLALSPKLGLHASSMGRAVTRLSTLTTKTGLRGWGLVEYRDDPDDRRASTVHLTSKGEKFLQQLLND